MKAAGNKMYDILFVCAANVGRSQIAEGFYNHVTNGVRAQSAAAIQDVGEKYDFRPHCGIVEVMYEKGIDISDQRVDMISKELVANSKKVVLFIAENECPDRVRVYLDQHPQVEYCVVKDPYPEDEKQDDLLAVFRKTRDVLEEIVLRLVPS